MNELLNAYLPLAVFIGVSLAIGAGLMLAPFLIAVKNPDPRRSRPTSAASTPSTMRA